MIYNFTTEAFNATGALSVYTWNSEVNQACLITIAFCQVCFLVMKLGDRVLKTNTKRDNK